MNLVCIVKVDVKASYELVEPKELSVAVKDYTSRGSECYSMSSDNRNLLFNETLELEFDSVADMVANFEKKLLDKLGDYIKWVENWNVAYNVKQVRGADVYF